MAVNRYRAPLPKNGLVAWYGPAALSALANGAAVATWSDASPTQSHQTQTTVAWQPTYVTNAWNGKPGVRFNGSTQWLSGASLVSGTGPRTIFVVNAPAAGVNTNAVLTMVSLTNTAPGATIAGGEFEISTEYAVRISGAGCQGWGPAGGGHAPTGQVHVLAVQVPGNGPVSGALGWFDGVSMAGNLSTNGVLAYNTVANGSVLGSWRQASTYFPGDLLEILVYNRVLTAYEFTRVSNYLRRQWGTP